MLLFLQCCSYHYPCFARRLTMMSQLQVKDSLREVVWQEGLVVPVAYGSYRHRIVVHCTKDGRQTATFADGQEHKYAGYLEFINAKGEWIKEGAGMVPVLPDGRLLMVVEQRPPQSRYSGRPTMAIIEGKELDLKQFGLHSSLEFPGGSVEPGQGLKAGFMAELTDETGVPDQLALCYSCLRPVCSFGSDIATRQHLATVFLSGITYKPYVAEDGGLQVFALTREEVQQNIWSGVICSGQAALNQWSFYKEVEKARADATFEQGLKDAGYLAIETLQLAKAKR